MLPRVGVDRCHVSCWLLSCGLLSCDKSNAPSCESWHLRVKVKGWVRVWLTRGAVLELSLRNDTTCAAVLLLHPRALT